MGKGSCKCRNVTSPLYYWLLFNNHTVSCDEHQAGRHTHQYSFVTVAGHVGKRRYFLPRKRHRMMHVSPRAFVFKVLQKTGTLVDYLGDDVMLTTRQGEGHPLQLKLDRKRGVVGTKLLALAGVEAFKQQPSA